MEVNHIEEMRHQGLSVTPIAEVTGFDHKTIRKYLAHLELEPRYKPRPGRPSLLDPLRVFELIPLLATNAVSRSA